MASSKVVKLVGEQAHIIVDYSYLPLIINKWTGTPDTGLIDDIYAARNANALRGDPPYSLVLIQDLSEMVAPSSTVRKYTADKQNNDPLLPKFERLLVIPVVPNPLLRGVMTAIVWMTGKENMPTEFAGSMAEGIAKALSAIESWGVPIPDLDPQAYTIPTDAEVWSGK